MRPSGTLRVKTLRVKTPQGILKYGFGRSTGRVDGGVCPYSVIGIASLSKTCQTSDKNIQTDTFVRDMDVDFLHFSQYFWCFSQYFQHFRHVRLSNVTDFDESIIDLEPGVQARLFEAGCILGVLLTHYGIQL